VFQRDKQQTKQKEYLL